jgi:four helix bundle protein
MKEFIAYRIALDAARELRQPLVQIQRRDRELEKQLRRATHSIVLNLAEGNRRRGQDRLHLFRIAAGSVAETRAALELAEAWAYIDGSAVARAFSLLDQMLAILWRLTEQPTTHKQSASTRP